MNCSLSFGNNLAEKPLLILLANDVSSVTVNQTFLYNLLLSMKKKNYLNYYNKYYCVFPVGGNRLPDKTQSF